MSPRCAKVEKESKVAGDKNKNDLSAEFSR